MAESAPPPFRYSGNLATAKKQARKLDDLRTAKKRLEAQAPISGIGTPGRQPGLDILGSEVVRTDIREKWKRLHSERERKLSKDPLALKTLFDSWVVDDLKVKVILRSQTDINLDHVEVVDARVLAEQVVERSVPTPVSIGRGKRTRYGAQEDTQIRYQSLMNGSRSTLTINGRKHAIREIMPTTSESFVPYDRKAVTKALGEEHVHQELHILID